MSADDSTTGAEAIQAPLWKRPLGEQPRWVWAIVALFTVGVGAAAWYGGGGSDALYGRGAMRPGVEGFDLSNAIVPLEGFRGGRFARDRIPALTDPKFVSVDEVDYLEPRDQVLGFVKDGEAHAYPLRIMIWHEVVNDTVGGVPIVATYCPLCGTGMVFDRRVNGEALTFGNSSMTYNNDLVFYDHQTDSLWSQLMAKAVTGKYAGTKLTWLPAEHMTWAAWKERYPESRVLSTHTGYARNYGGRQSDEHASPIAFSIGPKPKDGLNNRDWVLGIVLNGAAMAYPLDTLAADDDGVIKDTIGDTAVRVEFDPDSKRGVVYDADTQEVIPSVAAYWWAWKDFYPETALYDP